MCHPPPVQQLFTLRYQLLATTCYFAKHHWSLFKATTWQPLHHDDVTAGLPRPAWPSWQRHNAVLRAGAGIIHDEDEGQLPTTHCDCAKHEPCSDNSTTEAPAKISMRPSWQQPNVTMCSAESCCTCHLILQRRGQQLSAAHCDCAAQADVVLATRSALRPSRQQPNAMPRAGAHIILGSVDEGSSCQQHIFKARLKLMQRRLQAATQR
jgi:hypothetical protein